MKYSSSVTMAVALQAATAGLHSCINEVAGVTKGLRAAVRKSCRAGEPVGQTRC